MAPTSFQPCIYPIPDLVYSPEGKKKKSTFHITSFAPFQCPSISQQLNLNFFPLKSSLWRSSVNATSSQELFLIFSAARDCCLKVSNILKTLRFFLVFYYVPLLDFSFLTDRNNTPSSILFISCCTWHKLLDSGWLFQRNHWWINDSNL